MNPKEIASWAVMLAIFGLGVFTVFNLIQCETQPTECTEPDLSNLATKEDVNIVGAALINIQLQQAYWANCSFLPDQNIVFLPVGQQGQIQPFRVWYCPLTQQELEAMQGGAQ